MSGDDIASFLYLALLGSVIVGYYLVSNRNKMGELARNAALWGLIFVGAIAGVALWQDNRDKVLGRQMVSVETGSIEVPRAPDGHFYLTLDVGEVPIEFVVDTGATEVVLSLQDARRVGIDPDSLIFSGQAQTANGSVRTASATLDDVRLGPFEDGRVRVSVNEGAMDTSLLGMTYLRRFGRIEIAGDRLVLER
ncbi:retropepsin-like aspartic protease family protein [Litoreibacter roseus]|uniref:Aspartyl protease n=1 Tax=Litoreibacter roseus TaxID=2601869 RepID=A0A6N6JFJ9_9RHOB|nr:TIGR02281 family clan AA aspartic protease [Litoreibacter roseus]GFE64058.1 aspartyl protease [Litoreibacter roseus]